MNDVVAVDSTLLNYNNKWWLFTGIIENFGGPSSDELFLFCSDDPIDGTWIPHPLNPIISDVRNARSAGKIYDDGNKLVRPAQNCELGYGYGISLNEILELNENQYREKTIDSIYPTWDENIKGIHTLSHDEELTFVDIKFQKFN